MTMIFWFKTCAWDMWWDKTSLVSIQYSRIEWSKKKIKENKSSKAQAMKSFKNYTIHLDSTWMTVNTKQICTFQADLFTLFYMWFPCCTCLKTMIRRTNSSSTKESFIFRRQSTLRRSFGSMNGTRYHNYMINRRNVDSFQNGTIKEDSEENKGDNRRQFLELEEILEKENSQGIEICCDPNSNHTKARLVGQSSGQNV